MSELIYRRPCEHGEVRRHPTAVVLKDRLGPGKDDIGYDWEKICPGGSDLILDPDKVLVYVNTARYVSVADVLDVLNREA